MEQPAMAGTPPSMAAAHPNLAVWTCRLQILAPEAPSPKCSAAMLPLLVAVRGASAQTSCAAPCAPQATSKQGRSRKSGPLCCPGSSTSTGRVPLDASVPPAGARRGPRKASTAACNAKRPLRLPSARRKQTHPGEQFSAYHSGGSAAPLQTGRQRVAHAAKSAKRAARRHRCSGNVGGACASSAQASICGKQCAEVWSCREP
mmetsp:Transcript_105162/g.324374  ORF Transcript_105162/g.324374 Transcript_105162/m.324374 type:complete len:203 (-) Transcript_105162:8-616(-)